MLKEVNRNYVCLISQAFSQQDLPYDIAGKTDIWVQGTELGKIGCTLASDFRRSQLLRPRDKKRQIGEQDMSNITVSFKGIFKVDQRCFYATYWKWPRRLAGKWHENGPGEKIICKGIPYSSVTAYTHCCSLRWRLSKGPDILLCYTEIPQRTQGAFRPYGILQALGDTGRKQDACLAPAGLQFPWRWDTFG